MKQFKKDVSRVRPATPTTTSRQEIDAAIQALSEIVQKEPGKAAKIFEAWLDSSHQVKNKKPKRTAA